jgi:hypothetical protein
MSKADQQSAKFVIISLNAARQAIQAANSKAFNDLDAELAKIIKKLKAASAAGATGAKKAAGPAGGKKKNGDDGDVC